MSTLINVDDFEYKKKLGQGGFGSVWAAEMLKGRDKFKIFAVKAIDKRHRKSAKNEKLILELLSQCSFVIKLHYAFQSPSKLFLVLDLMPGGDLYSVFMKTNGLSDAALRFYLPEIILGLFELHRLNIIHLDLKPENILIDARGHIRLADFGLSKKLEPGLKGYKNCGTPTYEVSTMIEF